MGFLTQSRRRESSPCRPSGTGPTSKLLARRFRGGDTSQGGARKRRPRTSRPQEVVVGAPQCPACALSLVASARRPGIPGKRAPLAQVQISSSLGVGSHPTPESIRGVALVSAGRNRPCGAPKTMVQSICQSRALTSGPQMPWPFRAFLCCPPGRFPLVGISFLRKRVWNASQPERGEGAITDSMPQPAILDGVGFLVQIRAAIPARGMSRLTSG